MTTAKRLLAKSYDQRRYGQQPPDYALLLQHSRDVAAACAALAEMVGRIAFTNCALDESRLAEFTRTLKANGWMQDLGKANSHFQRLVTDEPQIRQLVRHETISGLLLWYDTQLREWLAPLKENLLLALWGAIGHHRKFNKGTEPQTVPPLTVHLSREDFATILQAMSEDLQLDPPPKFSHDLVLGRSRKDVCDWPLLGKLEALKDEFEKYEAAFADDASRRMLALIKGLGIGADIAASAVAAREKWANRYSLTDVVTHDLAIGLTPNDLTGLISHWAWARTGKKPEEKAARSLPADFEVRPFQRAVADSPSTLTLAKAGCGSGKSLAAYLWARNWCERLAQAGRTNLRLFFCLPTTGTTTEHFKDYALESGIESNLTHSRARVDLKAIAETVWEEDAAESGEVNHDAAKQAQAALNAERDKIEALALWSTRLSVTTADTVLGLLSNARKSVCSLPAILSSAIVFDEIHAFDEQMFGHLLVFLKHFPRLPVLLMTASLPEERKRAIAAVRSDLAVIPGPPRFEALKRYLLPQAPTGEALWQTVEKCLEQNGKVLWVRNRVEWANVTFDECRRLFPQCASNVYHSRFRYKDRSHRHRRVIDDFKRKNHAAILVATQVAEMSLDLSADLLITDIAPIPALIQRMGRLNRRATPQQRGEPKPALVCALPQGEKNAALPYKQEELDIAAQWLGVLRALNKPLSQHQLAKAFAQFNQAAEYDLAAAEKRAVFFSGLWETRVGQTRGDGYTMSVIREDDYKACTERDRDGDPTREWLREHEFSIPIRDEALQWPKVAGVRIAPRAAVIYDFDDKTKEGKGARWAKN